MEWERLSEDQLDRMIVRSESEIASWRAVEMAAITEKRSRRSHHVDGYRSIVDWVAARADVSHQTARAVCWTATRLAEAPEAAAQLATGEISFDRAEQLARLPEPLRQGHEGYDIAQLRGKVAQHRRLTRRRERVKVNGYLNFGASIDDIRVSFWGELPGLDSRIVEKAVDQRADEIITGETTLGVAARRALALVAICHDSLYLSQTQQESPPVDLTVVVDARSAAPDGGETGVSVLAGARIGPSALKAITCNGMVDVIGITSDGEPLRLGRRSRTIPRRLRHHILHRDTGCTVEGCSSRYRLEIHHVTPWSKGGHTDPDNLVTLCWYHHQIAVHREGLQIARQGPSRVRLKRPR
ncbi:MAG TPA: HNH endonuclease signature motif containing protein [Acidimicrobiia bacterium]